jgi:hypothetical protein
MTMPRGMVRHPKSGILWARKDVPKELREIVGQTSLTASLGTRDVKDARSLFHGVMQDFEARIASARKHLAGAPPGPVLLIAKDLGVSDGQMQAYFASRPENRIKVIADQMQAKLAEAGVVVNTPEPVSLDELFERWVKERQPAPNSKNEYERAKNLFKTLNEDKPISGYTNVDARKFKDAIVVKTARNGKPLSHASRVKWFSSIKTLFALADRNELLTTNPFAKILLEKPTKARTAKREEWEIEDLNTLFASPVYGARKRPRCAGPAVPDIRRHTRIALPSFEQFCHDSA